MALLKKIAFVRYLLSGENRIYWAAALVVLLLIILLVFLIKRRKRRRSKAASAGGQKTKQKALPRASLVKIWKEFLQEIPSKFRRSLILYKPFVLFGDSGVGKSLLVDNYTDWQGQAHQFYPSYTANPLLQIYLGSKVVVQEISAALLNDTSKQARAALLKLWKPLFRKKNPTVVIALNGAALQSSTPESLKRQAQIIRGKINLLSMIRKKPVKVCIALTHMDQREGFMEFSNFLRYNNIPLKLEFASKKDWHNLGACLEPYEDYMSLALTTLPAADYMKIISFLRDAPELFSVLNVFVKILQGPDPLSPEPEMIRLVLSSRKDEGESHVANPFASDLSVKEVRYDPLVRHKRAAAVLIILGLLYLSASYLYERHLLIKWDQAMDVMEASPPAKYTEGVQRLLLNCTAGEKQYPFLRYIPHFFTHINQENRRRLLKDIREFYLLPELKRFAEEGVAPEKVMYLLGLLYASQQNDLGTFILGRISEWEKGFDFSETLVRDYVKYNDIAQELTLPFQNLAIPLPTFNRQGWMVFFREVLKASQKSFLNKNELLELQEEGSRLLLDIKGYDRYDFYMKVCELLREEAPSVIRTIDVPEDKYSSDMEQKSIREFLDFLQGLDITYPLVEGLDLYQFLQNIKAMEILTRDEEGKKFRIAFADEEFIFSTKRWHGLIDCSRISLFMRDFVKQNKYHDGLLFFQIGSEFPDLIMNPSNYGLLFFTGKGKVNGVYTKDVFEEEVLPVLVDLPDFLKKLSISKEVKTLFSNFISKEVDAYAKDYVAEYLDYYQQFKVKASSLGELQYVLTQMQLPTSQFQDFLLTIKENTALNLEDSPYLQTFSLKLRTFGFIQRLMEERKGVFPELEKYKIILGQMQEDLKKETPFVAKNEMDEANELKSRLSPLGRISLAIFRNEDDSYLNLVEMWLKNVGISTAWQDLFLTPIYEAYLLGLTEVQAMVNKVWDELWVSNVQPIISKFPFDAKAANEVTSTELEAFVHPRGELWKNFTKYISPVCLKRGDTWTHRTAPLGTLKLPKEMLKTVNEIGRLTKTFWDEKGAPQAVIFSIKPLPLPPIEKDKPIVVLSYLRTGQSCVLGLNQQPAWQRFEFEWWKDQGAVVGVEFTTSGNRKNYREIKAPESNWSFYQLLRMAQLEENMLTWRIKGFTKNRGSNVLAIKFAIKENPWSLFQLAQPEKSGPLAKQEIH